MIFRRLFYNLGSSNFIKMKVRFFSNYEQSENLLKRFKANYIVTDQELTFTLADDYDFAVVFNGSNEPVKTTAKIITIVQEPSWSGFHDYKNFLTHSDYLIVHDAELFEHNHHVKLGGQVIETASYMFYDDKVDRSFFDHTESIPKEKKLSIIVSSLSFDVGSYRKRLNLLSKILASDLDIDIYGRGFNIPDQRYKGTLDYKYKGLLPYEYSIAIENSNERNYITEKFVDCTLCNTIPIYNGAPNIAEIYDDRYFKWIDLDNENIIETLKSIILEPAPISSVNKDIYFQKHNLYTKLKEIIYQ